MNQITHLKTVNFMGKSINEPISQKMIYTGENTSGKSMRSIAITLGLLGFIPFSAKPAKKAGDILKDYGDGKSMSVEITCDGHKFERSFIKSKKTGVVSQKLTYDGSKIAKGIFEVKLFKSGAPHIVDVNAFIKSSDTDRISTLFKLYPPEGDITSIDSSIEKVKSKISGLNEKITQCEATVKSNTDTKSAIEMPVGTLAEVQKQIVDLTENIKVAREELNAENIRIAEENATKKAQETDSNDVKKPEQSNKNTEAQSNQAGFNQAMANNTQPWTAPQDGKVVDADFVAQDQENQRIHNFTNGKDISKYGDNTNSNIDLPSMQDPAVSIQTIIDAMESSGCALCAALMVARVELRKFK